MPTDPYSTKPQHDGCMRAVHIHAELYAEPRTVGPNTDAAQHAGRAGGCKHASHAGGCKHTSHAGGCKHTSHAGGCMDIHHVSATQLPAHTSPCWRLQARPLTVVLTWCHCSCHQQQGGQYPATATTAATHMLSVGTAGCVRWGKKPCIAAGSCHGSAWHNEHKQNNGGMREKAVCVPKLSRNVLTGRHTLDMVKRLQLQQGCSRSHASASYQTPWQ
jgi:hypothetical protein